MVGRLGFDFSASSELDPDATAVADSGGPAIAFLHPIEGGEQIANAWVEVANRAATTWRCWNVR